MKTKIPADQIVNFIDDELLPIHDKVVAGERLTYDDGVLLFRTRDLLGLGMLAN